MASGNVVKMLMSIGSALSIKNVMADDNRPLIACVMFMVPCSPKDSVARKLLRAPFIAAKDPVNVSSASFAVVPVIPRFCWITCIAEYTSERFVISYLTPVSFCASASKRSISVFVPP